jgi:nitronate monooxygenase
VFKLLAHDSKDQDMGSFARRGFLKATAATGIAMAITGEQRARAQGTPRASWPNKRLIDLLKIEHPIVQAPMAGHVSPDLPVAVCEAGGLGSFPCTTLTPAQVREEVTKIRTRVSKPLNVNFFCHAVPERNETIEDAWRKRLAPYYAELGVDQPAAPTRTLAPFGAEMCDVVVEFKPEVVSFHYGLPEASLVKRVKDAGCTILSSATTVEEARWLEDHGADAIIAQGAEAGGHRGMFLTTETASQIGTFALVRQVVDVVKIPVIAAGGVSDGRSIAAALALGASAVQMGTAYLLCPEARISALHRAALKSARDNITVITNVLTGRPARVFMNRIARELGPIAPNAPPFPLPGAALAPLRAKAEAQGSTDYSPLYAGQAAALCRELPAKELTVQFATEALEKVSASARPG